MMWSPQALVALRIKCGDLSTTAAKAPPPIEMTQIDAAEKALSPVEMTQLLGG
jgi:hypothetical protein